MNDAPRGRTKGRSALVDDAAGGAGLGDRRRVDRNSATQHTDVVATGTDRAVEVVAVQQNEQRAVLPVVSTVAFVAFAGHGGRGEREGQRSCGGNRGTNLLHVNLLHVGLSPSFPESSGISGGWGLRAQTLSVLISIGGPHDPIV